MKKTKHIPIKEIIESSQLENLAYECHVPNNCIHNHIDVSHIYSNILVLVGIDDCVHCREINNVIFDSTNFIIYTMPYSHELDIKPYKSSEKSPEEVLIIGYIWLEDKWIYYGYNHILNDFCIKGKRFDKILSLNDNILPKNYCHFFAKTLDSRNETSKVYYLFSFHKIEKTGLRIPNLVMNFLSFPAKFGFQKSNNSSNTTQCFTVTTNLYENNVDNFLRILGSSPITKSY
jgi:hypothetical protein